MAPCARLTRRMAGINLILHALFRHTKDPKKIIRKLHVNWGHGSAQQLRRVLADSVGETVGLVTYANEV